MTILADSGHTGDTNDALTLYSHSLTGDALAVLAAVIYGVMDAVGEFWAKKIDRTEYLGMIGFLGSFWTLLIFPFLEGEDIYHAFSNPNSLPGTIVLVAAYAIFLAAYYMLATLFMVKCDATLLNLSLQASNLWAILFSTVAFHEAPPTQFYFAVILVASGVCIYELCNGVTSQKVGIDSKIVTKTGVDTRTDADTEYQVIPLRNPSV